MKKTTSVALALLAGITLMLSGCNDPKKEEVVTPALQDRDHCTSSLAPDAEKGIDPSQVDFSFVFMGCNRVATYDASNASTANVFQLQRTFNEVCAMRIKPKFFFFLGDLVLGLDTVNDTLRNELKAWITQFRSPKFSSMPGSDIKFIAVPGNHEMLYEPGHVPPDSVIKKNEPKDKSKKKAHKSLKPLKPEVPWAKASSIWQNLMQSFSIQPSDDYDLKQAPEDKLTYSFNYKGTHFVILNTDMYSEKDPYTPGLAPASWICNDISSAKDRSDAKHVFVMGHKPGYIILDATRAFAASQDDIIDTNVTDKIWPVMEKHKVEAMLSAHRHEFSVLQPHASKTYQIIAGNGGSNYESHLPINNQFFGFTKIYVMKDGRIIARSFGRLTPSSAYTTPLPCDTLTRVRYDQDVTWGTRSAWFSPTDSIQRLFGKKK